MVAEPSRPTGLMQLIWIPFAAESTPANPADNLLARALAVRPERSRAPVRCVATLTADRGLTTIRRVGESRCGLHPASPLGMI